MKTLHKFVIKAYLGPLVLTFFIVLFILLMQFLWKYIDDLAGKGIPAITIAEFLVYASTSLVPMALPLAILMASLMTFGNFGEHFELSALKSSGISLQRIMAPLIYLILIVCVLAFLFSNHVLPYSNLKMRSLLWDFKNQRLELQIKEGIFYSGIDGYSIKVGKKNKKTGLMEDVMLYDHSINNGNTKVTVADSGYMKFTANKKHLMVSLFKGYSYSEEQESRKKRRNVRTYPHRRDKFEKEVFFLSLDGFEFQRNDESLFKDHYQMMNLKQLEEATDTLKKQYDERVSRFHKSLVNYNIYRNVNYAKKDTVKETTEFNLDSIFNSLTLADKKLVISRALNYARSAKSLISSSNSELSNRRKHINKHMVEWHRKFTLSFACFIFFFIGAPLGAIIRKGGLGMPAVISVVFFLIYYILSISGEKLVRESVWNAFSGMWLSSFILLPLGIFLTYKATSDSVIMNIETYFIFYKRISDLPVFKFFKNKLSKTVDEQY